MIDNFEDFKRYVDKYNRLPNGFSSLTKPLNDRQLLKKFETYTKRENKKIEKKKQKKRPFSHEDEQWVSLKEDISILDKDECQLLESLRIMSEEDSSYLPMYREAQKVSRSQPRLDPAHVLARSGYHLLKYDIENVILLSRVFHSRLDFGKNPLTGQNCSREEILDWWDITLTARSKVFGKEITIDYLRSKDLDLRRSR